MNPEIERQPLTRKQLYDLVWSTPMSKLAKTLHCSDVWLARICKECGVPTPEGGYWAKKRAGKRVSKRNLSKRDDPNEVVLRVDPKPPASPAAPPAPPPQFDPDIAARLEELEKAAPIGVLDGLSRPTRLVAEARRALRRGSRYADMFGLLAEPHDGLAIHVSEECLDRALRIFDALLLALASNGFKTTKSDSPRCHHTTTEVLGERFVFRIRERVRRLPGAGWKPLAILQLELRVQDGKWVRRRWTDGRRTPLEAKLSRVLRDTLLEVQEARKRKADRKRRETEWREAEERRRREEEARRVEEKLVEKLLSQVERWHRASRIRRFVRACRERTGQHGLPDLEEWARWAECFADRTDPLRGGMATLREASDALSLGASEPGASGTTTTF